MTRDPVDARPTLLIAVNDAGFFLSHRLPIAKAAAKAGYDVHIAAMPGPHVESIVSLCFPFHPIPLSRRGLNPWHEAQAFFALYRLFRMLEPDIVHLVTIKPVLYGGLAARLARAPAVVSAISGLGYLFTGGSGGTKLLRAVAALVYRFALGHANGRVIFQNPDDMAEFVSRGVISSEVCTLIKGSGVDVERFVPRQEPEGMPVVMFASRMLRHKGIQEFVEAVGVLRSQGVDARYVLVGESDPGNPSAISQKQLLIWDAEEVVEWWGHRQDMPDVLTQAHVICLPSYREGLPKVLLEAAACGRPVIATDVPGCREIVRDGENGLLVPPGDVWALVSAIRRLVSEPELRHKMGVRGRKIVETEFNLERVVDQTLAVYDLLLPSRRIH